MKSDEKSILWFSLLILPVYLAVCGLYTSFSHPIAQESWNEVVAPWLGEAPAGITSLICEPIHPEEFSDIVYVIPAGGDWKERIVRTFGMRECPSPGEVPGMRRLLLKTLDYTGDFRLYDMGDANRCVWVQLPEEYRSAWLSDRSLSPYLLELADGRLVFCEDAQNRLKDAANAVELTPAYLQYLSKFSHVRIFFRIGLGVVLYLLPSLFCCIGRLWVQRARLRNGATLFICLVLPLLVLITVPMLQNKLFGLPMPETLEMVFHLVFNGITVVGLMLLTYLIRLTFRCLRRRRG